MDLTSLQTLVLSVGPLFGEFRFVGRLWITSVRQRHRPLYGYSPPSAYVRRRRRLQYGYGPTATYVRKWLLYISHAVSE